MIHTILPPEGLQQQSPPPVMECIPCACGWLQGTRTSDGRFTVGRIISTDPAAYLRAEWQPGQTCFL